MTLLLLIGIREKKFLPDSLILLIVFGDVVLAVEVLLTLRPN